MSSTWRELLGKITSDPAERLRIAESLGVSTTTLFRWVTNRSNPRIEKLHLLLEILPRIREEFAELIEREYPDLLARAMSIDDIPHEIPSEFYAKVLSAHTTSAALLRTTSVTTLLLQQFLAQLDPQQIGMVVAIFQCVPPQSDHKVHSLRITHTRTASPWRHPINHPVFFVGAESLAGDALLSGHPVIVQSREARQRWFPTHPTNKEGSFAAFPIMRSDRTAGTLSVYCPQPSYFTHAHLDLVQAYTDLAVLMFQPEEYFLLSSLQLGILPPYDVQQPYLITFQQRLSRRMIHASRNDLPLSRIQAEQSTWQEIENELLHLTLYQDASRAVV